MGPTGATVDARRMVWTGPKTLGPPNGAWPREVVKNAPQLTRLPLRRIEMDILLQQEVVHGIGVRMGDLFDGLRF